MGDYRPLFVTSTARSGADLISMMLSANPQVMVALDPYLELFRSLRNTFVEHYAPPEAREAFDASAPVQDYYFSEHGLTLMDAIQRGDLDLPFDQSTWDAFLERGVRRCSLDSADIAPHFAGIRGRTYREMFENGLAVIAKARSLGDRRWIGFKDSWTIEFLRPLAVAFPEARFVVIRRDPRATINSNLGGVTSDPLGVAHALSYLRHWRKYVAFAVHYQQDPLFANRLFVITHEEVLRAPETKARELCRFLEVDYDPRMIDTNTYFDYPSGGTWKGNSTFESVTSGISPHRAERWRKKLEPRVVKMIEFLCGADIRLIGDAPLVYGDDGWPSPEILEYLIESDSSYANWRTDMRDPQRDYGFELFRHALLALPSPPADARLIRRSFLFEDVYARLREVAAAGTGQPV